MQGEFKGAVSFFKPENPNYVYVLWSTRVANLSACNLTTCTVPVITYFRNIQALCVSFKDSYKKIEEWQKEKEKVNIFA